MTRTQASGALVCAPLRLERAALRGLRAPAARTGMGSERSRRHAAALRGRPVLVAGVAGGVATRVRPGDVVVASQVRGPGGATRPCPSAQGLARAIRDLGLTVHEGPIASVARLVRGRDRDALAALGVLAVDMESFWLAPERDEPFAVARVITDTPDAPLARPGVVARGVRALLVLRRIRPALDAWAASANAAAMAAPPTPEDHRHPLKTTASPEDLRVPQSKEVS